MYYKVIHDGSFEYLAGKVQAAIREGWKPIGGVCAVPVTNGTGGAGIYLVCQAMIKD